MSLKDRLQQDMQAAMRSGDKARLSVLRMALAGVKQREVDTRRPLDDALWSGFESCASCGA